MTSLTQKRYIARLASLTPKHENRDTINMENVNLNTDQLETKLSNIQTINDTKLSSLVTFLDKDSGVNFHNKLTNDKLDTIITNTFANEYASTYSTVISGSGTFTTASTDLGAATDRHKIHILGNLTSGLVNISMELSHNNVTYYKDNAFNFTILGNAFSCMGQTNFRYFRIKVVDTSGSSNTLNMESVAKNV